MKLLFTLLILSLVSYIRATEVYTQFTLSGGDDSCTKENGVFQVDACTPLCNKANVWGLFTYNFETGNTDLSLWDYKSCAGDNLIETYSFNCSAETPTANDYNVACANQVKLTNFTSFEVSVPVCEPSTINLEIDTCTEFCTSVVKYVSAPGYVNGYFPAYFGSIEECEAATNVEPFRLGVFQCLNDNAPVIDGDASTICYEDKENSSSIISYSMALLVSIVLLNLLF